MARAKKEAKNRTIGFSADEEMIDRVNAYMARHPIIESWSAAARDLIRKGLAVAEAEAAK